MKLYLASNFKFTQLVDAMSADMKVHLVGQPTRSPEQMRAVVRSGHPYRLLSYIYFKDNVEALREFDNGPGTIVDSGLYSFMFGSERGKMPDTYEAYYDFTKRYLDDLARVDYSGYLVETDAHRLLGMEAVHRLRELFEPLRHRTIYAWHEPEGLDGLVKLAKERDYIAIGLPELRRMAGVVGGSDKVQRMLNDLIRRVHRGCAAAKMKPPKIHLLGCTVQGMMQTQLAYSCDSTSWLSGVRYGTGVMWLPDKGLCTVGLRSPAFKKWAADSIKLYPEAEKFARTQGNPEYYFNVMGCARAYVEYQRWLDTTYTSVEVR